MKHDHRLVASLIGIDAVASERARAVWIHSKYRWERPRYPIPNESKESRHGGISCIDLETKVWRHLFRRYNQLDTNVIFRDTSYKACPKRSKDKL